jgi:protein-S-isoprenylcysteine O-methyltransferase Ste14
MGHLSAALKANPRLATQVQDAYKVGIHWSTPVVHTQHSVCQVLCSAAPVAYVTNTTTEEWAVFATTLLQAAYDCTLLAAAILAVNNDRRVQVFLTKLGAGAFGNKDAWVLQAMKTVCVCLFAFCFFVSDSSLPFLPPSTHVTYLFFFFFGGGGGVWGPGPRRKKKAIDKLRDEPLDIFVVHYGHIEAQFVWTV